MRAAIVIAACMLVSHPAIAGKDYFLKYGFHFEVDPLQFPAGQQHGWAGTIVFDSIGGNAAYGHVQFNGGDYYDIAVSAFRNGGEICAMVNDTWMRWTMWNPTFCWTQGKKNAIALKSKCYEGTDPNDDERSFNNCLSTLARTTMTLIKRQP